MTRRSIMRTSVKLYLLGVLIALTSSIALAEIYLFEDFESYNVGENLDTSDLWEKHQDADAPGEASDSRSCPPGGKSGYFPGRSGIKHTIEAEELPEEFFISACYYHNPSEDPPPHYMLVFRGVPGEDWLGVGTVETVSNYSIRDKRGTGQETDTGVKRKDWINIVWRASVDGTDVFLDGEEVHNSIITGGAWGQAGSFIWFADVWSGASEAYVDSIVIADTLEEATEMLAVEPERKASTTWAAMKMDY
jgi:hypothetical protein